MIVSVAAVDAADVVKYSYRIAAIRRESKISESALNVDVKRRPPARTNGEELVSKLYADEAPG